MGIDATTDPMRHREAVAWFSARTVVTREAWDAMDAAGRSRAFMVSGLTNLAVVSDVHESITRAVAEGTTLADFKRQMEAQLTEAWGKPNAARVETIFRTNVQTAYNAARFEQLNRPAMRLARPFWRYSAVLDGRTTDTCKPLDQVIRPADDAWWKTHWPPLHFNCRSTVVSLSRSQAEEAGGVSAEPKTSPAQGFGATPDLSGEKLMPPANTEPELREAYYRRLAPARRELEPVPQDVVNEALGEVFGDQATERWCADNGISVHVHEDVISDGAGEALGRYDHTRRLIELSSNVGEYRGFFNPGDPFVDEGASTAREAFARLATHELAHAIHAHLPDETRARVEALFRAAAREGRCISTYATHDVDEYFAECFTAYRFERSDLVDVDPGMDALLRDVVRTQKLPP